MRIVLALVCFTCQLRAQTDQRNEVTFGGGFAKSIGRLGSEIDTVVGLGGTYGYRLLPYLQLESGAVIALSPTARICTSGDHCFDGETLGEAPLQQRTYDQASGDPSSIESDSPDYQRHQPDL